MHNSKCNGNTTSNQLVVKNNFPTDFFFSFFLFSRLVCQSHRVPAYPDSGAEVSSRAAGEGDTARRDRPGQTGSERWGAAGSTSHPMKGNRKRAGGSRKCWRGPGRGWVCAGDKAPAGRAGSSTSHDARREGRVGTTEGGLTQSWQVASGSGGIEAGYPAEDKSDKRNMTLPKANLASLRDDLSRFFCTSCGGSAVITRPYKTAWVWAGSAAAAAIGVLSPVQNLTISDISLASEQRCAEWGNEFLQSTRWALEVFRSEPAWRFSFKESSNTSCVSSPVWTSYLLPSNPKQLLNFFLRNRII